jgi:hypothetical protein
MFRIGAEIEAMAAGVGGKSIGGGESEEIEWSRGLTYMGRQ